jgi:hypothetical protein
MALNGMSLAAQLGNISAGITRCFLTGVRIPANAAGDSG